MRFSKKLLGIKKGEVEKTDYPDTEIIKDENELLIVRIGDEFRPIETEKLGRDDTMMLLYELLSCGASFSDAASAIRIINHVDVTKEGRIKVKVSEKKRLLTLLSSLGINPAFLGDNPVFAEGFETVFLFGERIIDAKNVKRLFLYKDENAAENAVKDRKYIIVLEDR